MTEIRTRLQAKELGLKLYFLGPDFPCGRGHVAERYVSNRGCIVCLREDAPSWRRANSNKIRTYKTTETYLKKARDYQAQYRTDNYAKARASQRAWAAKNPEKVKLYRQNTAAKPEMRAALQRAYLARKKKAPGQHTAADVEAIYHRQGGRCRYCRKEVGDNYHVDHRVPLTKGGSNWPANLQILCPPCNNAKKDQDPNEYERSIGFDKPHDAAQPDDGVGGWRA